MKYLSVWLLLIYIIEMVKQNTSNNTEIHLEIKNQPHNKICCEKE